VTLFHRCATRIKAGASSLVRTLRDNPILAVFIALALGARLTFWFYTGRVWEDALITITAARNVWEGFGLTHHASEPYVQSFTSPISVLIPIVGESLNAGLLALRLSSLAASVATIYFAYRIGVLLAFRWVAHVLVLTYLACDQLHIFFGMGGMETQVVTAVALATLYFYLDKSWWALGFACGFAALSRPEFVMFLLPPVGVALLIFHWRVLHKVAIPALAVALPWYLFATLYYGSPIPNTIVAKSWSYQIRMFSGSWAEIWNFTIRSWRDYAPFKEFWVSYQAPLPDITLKGIVALVLLLVVAGTLLAAKRKPALLIAAAAVIGFVAYRNSTILNSYYMWYLPPFTALLFVLAGYGLSELAARARWPASALGIILAFAYALPMPFSMPLDKKVQEKIEVEVRQRTGYLLAGLMKNPDDTVVLEPLGFIGWAAFNRTVYDYPGLGSKVAVRAVKTLSPPRVAGLVHALQPTYAVLRPNEFGDLTRRFPETAAKYELAARIRTPPGLSFRNMGYSYRLIDHDFRILRRIRDFEQAVLP
jgi:4-amino-4-deoxy-L-arabinose transferase-like glycosyltransferase